jgi:alanine racemase
LPGPSTRRGGKETLRPLRATIDLDCVRRNVSFLKGLTSKDCMIMAVVKANAYGHGDVQVASAALSAGADCLGVALVEEGARLRDAGFDDPVYLLFEPPPAAAEAAVELDLICSVYSEPYAKALAEAARLRGKTALVHIKVDSGMHRVGVPPDAAEGFATALTQMEGLKITGIYTHFAVASEPSNPFTSMQMRRFEETSARIESMLGRRLIKHAANSAGVMAFPDSNYDMVRVGIAMLGLKPSDDLPMAERLEPALSLGGEVAFAKRVAAGEGVSYGLTYAPARPTTILTLPVGYADGFSRLLSGKADVLIGGKRRRVIGTVCMDVCMVDAGDDDVGPGEPFVLIGTDGIDRISAEEVAGKMGTINYEVVCMISSRVPRVFLDEKGDAR